MKLLFNERKSRLVDRYRILGVCRLKGAVKKQEDITRPFGRVLDFLKLQFKKFFCSSRGLIIPLIRTSQRDIISTHYNCE